MLITVDSNCGQLSIRPSIMSSVLNFDYAFDELRAWTGFQFDLNHFNHFKVIEWFFCGFASKWNPREGWPLLSYSSTNLQPLYRKYIRIASKSIKAILFGTIGFIPMYPVASIHSDAVSEAIGSRLRLIQFFREKSFCVETQQNRQTLLSDHWPYSVEQSTARNGSIGCTPKAAVCRVALDSPYLYFTISVLWGRIHSFEKFIGILWALVQYKNAIPRTVYSVQCSNARSSAHNSEIPSFRCIFRIRAHFFPKTRETDKR